MQPLPPRIGVSADLPCLPFDDRVVPRRGAPAPLRLDLPAPGWPPIPVARAVPGAGWGWIARLFAPRARSGGPLAAPQR